MTYGNNTKQNNGFEIIGNDPKLNRAIEKAIQVAQQIFQYWLGEVYVGKESIPKIIHALSQKT
jgi:transcriptional regulator with PAS, ATPase and Fis domain